MYSSITIEGFRCFPRFELHGLDRINLLVGANNSGKTALLEAIALIKAKGSPQPIVDAAFRRGEVVRSDDGDGPRADVRRLFHGHTMSAESIVVITGVTTTSTERATVRMGTGSALKIGRRNSRGAEIEPVLLHGFTIDDEGVSSGEVVVDAHGGLVWSDGSVPDPAAARSIPTGSLSGDELVEMISPLLLTDREQLLLEALRIIDDEIEGFRIAPLPNGRRYLSRECAIVKLRSMRAPVPIGSLGDGVWRLFTLATAMASATGSVVLVDDIDTGLHYSVMEQMWRQIAAMATRLDVQVFATTHSRDCYEALSAVEAGSATIHRVERGRTRSVVFGGPMVAAAAANDVEVR